MATIKNLETLDLSEDERKRLEELLQSTLEADSEDLEFQGFLMNFVNDADGTMTLDAQEVWQSEYVRERFTQYDMAISDDVGLDNLLAQFGDLPDEGQEPLSAEDIEAAGTPAADWDSPLPDSTLDVPESFDSPQTDQGSTDGIEATGSTSPDVAPEGVESIPETSQEATAAPENEASVPVAPAAAPEEDQTLRNLRTLSETMAPLMGAGGGGESNSGPEKSTVGDGLSAAAGHVSRLGTNVMKAGYGVLKGGGAMSAGAIAGGAGAALGLTSGVLTYAGKGARYAGTKAAPHLKKAATASTGAVSSLTSKLRGALSGQQTKFSGSEMEQLRGGPANDNVIDMRQRLAERINSHDRDSVQRQVALMGDARLVGQQNALLSTMNDIDEGAPNGRYSEIEVADGLKLGALLGAAKSADPTVAAMAKAHLSSPEILNAANEMEHLSCEYQEVGDALESTIEHAQKQGWSDEEIGEQFGKPMEEWLERRMEEDQQLAELANQQDNGLSEDEVKERQDAVEKMAENIKKMLDKLFGRNQAQDAEKGSSVSMSR